MRVVFNNAVMCVMDYPGIEAVEVLDHRSGCGALMREGIARSFRQDFEGFLSQGYEDASDFSDFLDRYSGLFFHTAVLH